MENHEIPHRHPGGTRYPDRWREMSHQDHHDEHFPIRDSACPGGLPALVGLLAEVEATAPQPETMERIDEGHGEHSTIHIGLVAFLGGHEILQVAGHEQEHAPLVTEPAIAILMTEHLPDRLRPVPDVYSPRLTVADGRSLASLRDGIPDLAEGERASLEGSDTVTVPDEFAEINPRDGAPDFGPADLDHPSFLAAQVVGRWHRPLGGGRISAVEPLLRVGWTDPDRSRGSTDSLLLTPGLALYVGGSSKVAVNWDVYAPDVGDTEESWKVQAWLHF